MFPHQVVVRIEEVYASGHQKENEDGQVLKECIGQTARWSRNAIHGLQNVPLNITPNTRMADQFSFNDNMLCMNVNKFDKRNQSLDEHGGGEESFVEISAKGLHACAKFSVSGVDSLAPNVQKRKYSMTIRVVEDKGERRIGSSRAQKVSLARVEQDLKSNLCSRGCLKKLNASAILMKQFKAWGSNEYEERASWILKNLTENYNEVNHKFETKLCGQSVCKGCYAVALGYSKRRIEELKSNIRSTGIISEVFDVQYRERSFVVHGNTVRVPQTRLGIQAMESVFQKYM